MFPSAPFVVNCVLSVTFTSYDSNSFGIWIIGCLINFKFPAPLTTTRIVTGLPAFISFLSNCAERLKWPTPPEKSAGRLGKGKTLIANPGATISLLIFVLPPSIPKASNGLNVFDSCMTPWNVNGGTFNVPVICGYITYWLQVTQLYKRLPIRSLWKVFCCGKSTSCTWKPTKSGILPMSWRRLFVV